MPVFGLKQDLRTESEGEKERRKGKENWDSTRTWPTEIPNYFQKKKIFLNTIANVPFKMNLL